jgi:hypothetical protein
MLVIAILSHAEHLFFDKKLRAFIRGNSHDTLIGRETITAGHHFRARVNQLGPILPVTTTYNHEE